MVGLPDSALRSNVIDAVEPGQRQAADIGRIDLRQRAEAAAGVIAIVSGPVALGRGAEDQAHASRRGVAHFKVTR